MTIEAQRISTSRMVAELMKEKRYEQIKPRDVFLNVKSIILILEDDGCMEPWMEDFLESKADVFKSSL